MGLECSGTGMYVKKYSAFNVQRLMFNGKARAMQFEDRGKTVPNHRIPDAAVNPMFLERWSPRAFDPAPLPEEDIATLFEAARWAPSCFNEQPWLFVYGTLEEERSVFLEILSEKNGVWAHNAPILAILFARRTFASSDKPNRWAPFDCGAAWVSLALQARSMGLYAHGMAGFSREKAYQLLNVPEEEYDAMAAIAVGMYGDRDNLDERFKETEQPNTRKPLSEVAVKGKFQQGVFE
jgi:nitroreductase